MWRMLKENGERVTVYDSINFSWKDLNSVHFKMDKIIKLLESSESGFGFFNVLDPF